MSLKLICNASRYSFKKQIKPFTIESAINHKKTNEYLKYIKRSKFQTSPLYVFLEHKAVFLYFTIPS